MSRDDERAWQDGRERRIAADVERTVVEVDELARRYVVLLGMVSAGSGPAAREDGSARRPAGPRSPVRLDVMDLLLDVEGLAWRYGPLVRGALRLGLGGPVGTRAARVGGFFALVADNLAGVYADNEQLGAELTRELRHVNRRAGRTVGEVAAPFRLDVDCEDCGHRSLLVHPARMLIRCARPGCGAVQAVQWSRLVATH